MRKKFEKNSNENSAVELKVKKLVFKNNTVYFQSKQLPLSLKLSKLFYWLLSNEGGLVTRHVLIEKIWTENNLKSQRNLTHNICILRKKLEHNFGQSLSISTISKAGYLLKIKSTQLSAESENLINLKKLGWPVSISPLNK